MRIKILLFNIFGWMFSSLVFSQELIQIIHTNGNKSYKGVDVKVTGSGRVDSLKYCNDDTWPYYIGYNSGAAKAGDGSYSFNFSVPVKEVVINLSALSHSEGSYSEEARIWINDQPYKVKAGGEKNSCGEPMVIITPEGFIRPCKNCTGSGINGIRITGNITMVKIECNIQLGEPMGFVAAIFIRPGKINQEFETSVEENASGEGKEIHIKGNNLNEAGITVKDQSGYTMPLLFRKNENTCIILDARDFQPGTYNIEIKLNGVSSTQQVLIP